ncbi:MAG: 2-succinyl-5-enolpyruvyl-6-hydroxy-3-cyclohexene-1-carboxylic-acid synthase [Marinifilaceae bacterium]
MGEQLSDSKSVKILADICISKGLKKLVFSSGSRNAPLILTFNRMKSFETYTITDERSAAFFALGLSEQTGEAVALVCTSGTAVLNYSPAIAEAYYKGIPLLVLSADRPIEQIDQGDGQAIRQVGALSNFVKYSASLPIVDKKEDEWHVKNLLTNAFFNLSNAKKGPVHINIPLREPLYGTCEYTEEAVLANILPTENTLSEENISFLNEEIKKYKKVLILPCTTNKDKRLSRKLEELSKQSKVVVLTETINNLHSDAFFNGVDKYIKSIFEDSNEYSPDLIISFGDILISRMIKKYIQKVGLKAHWHISENAQHIDMFHNLKLRLDINPNYFFDNVELEANLDYRNLFLGKKKEIEDFHDTFLQNIEWSDFKAFTQLVDVLPNDYIIHSGNSTIIRYLQIFDKFAKQDCFCNRGTSGIDGSVSTAVGASWINGKKNLIITGDLSFYYDSNALWNRYLSKDLKIIVINNQGGGIFRFIEGPSVHEELGEFFEHHQERDVEHIAKAFNFEYLKANDEDSLSDKLDVFFRTAGKTILEIVTPREQNDIILRRYFNNINNK